MPRFNSPEAEARWRAAVQGRKGKKRGPYKKAQEESPLAEPDVNRKFSREFYLDADDAAEECGLTKYSFKEIVKALDVGFQKRANAVTYFRQKDIIAIRVFKQLMDDLEMGVRDTLKVQRAIAKQRARKVAAIKEPETYSEGEAENPDGE